MGVMNIKQLINLKLPADGYRLAFSIAGRVAPASGFVHCTTRQFASELGIRERRVRDLVRLLARCSLVHRINPRLLVVNPYWCYNGAAAQHANAVAEWSRFGMSVHVGKKEKAA